MRRVIRSAVRSVGTTLLVGCATACTGPGGTHDGSVDGSRDAISMADVAGDRVDATTMDAGPRCSADIDCADGVYCNGIERCAPGAANANARGCTPAPGPPCMASQTCDENNQRCMSNCPHAPDADGDGHQSSDCGGDDCDDADPMRFPGNPEVCDSTHDEDCNPMTLGTDADGDGAQSSMCCNTGIGGALVCGADCNDNDVTIHPGATEACNATDDDCDGMTDETFTCIQGSSRSCTHDCAGSAISGTQNCLADCSGYSQCTSSEACNGCDDNLDGQIDEGFACRYGSSQSCTTMCGTGGSQACDSACGGFGACNAAVETCNYCDDVGDGGDDRTVGTTHMITATCSSGITPSGSATCYPIATSPGQSGSLTWGTVRVGWDTVRAQATMYLIDGGPDGLAPAGTVSININSGATAFASSIGVTWDVGSSGLTIATRSGLTFTTVTTYTLAGIGVSPSLRFNTDQATFLGTLAIEYRPSIDGAQQQVRVIVGDGTSPWYSFGTAGTSFYPPGSTLYGTVSARVTTSQWSANIQPGSSVTLSAADSCP